MTIAKRLLLVHGFGGAREDFTDWLPALADMGWEAAAPQLPGHGTVDGPDAYGLERFADFVIGFVDGLGWDHYVLLGHSMGGFVAQLAALRQPARLDGLVLMGTGHGMVDDVEPELVEAGKHVVRTGGLAGLVEAQRGLPPDTAAHGRLLADRPGYAEWCEAKTLAMDPEMWLAVVDDMVAQPDRLSALRGLDVPALVIVGEQDARFLEPSRRMAAALPNARLAVLADAGHSPQLETPELWWKTLSTFLHGLDGRPPGTTDVGPVGGVGVPADTNERRVTDGPERIIDLEEIADA
jgi:pimeloyl-ACP methyl ester carboxylesterase